MIASALDDLKAFLSVRIRRGRKPALDEEQELAIARTRAMQAEQLTSSDVFVTAFQDELAEIVDAALAVDLSVAENHPNAIALLMRARELLAIAGKLRAYQISYANAQKNYDAYRRRRRR